MTFKFSMPSPTEMSNLIEFCRVMAGAPFYSKLGPGGVMAIFLTAKENNLPLMSCLNGGMHTFDGKVTFSAQLINAMIINAGHKVDVLHLDCEKCVIRFKRNDRDADKSYTGFIYEYNLSDAQKAGYLVKNNWKNSPKDMLFSRCLTGGGRKHIPEVFVGILVSGELVGDNKDSEIIPDIPLLEKKEQIKPSIEKLDGYEDFCEKHELQDNEIISEKREYILMTAEKSNLSEMQIINAAMKHEESFESRFEAWKQKRAAKT